MPPAPADSKIPSRFSSSVAVSYGWRRAHFANHRALLAVPPLDLALDSAGRRDDRAASLGKGPFRFATQKLVQRFDHVLASVMDRATRTHCRQQPPGGVLESCY